ncbi:MAG: hypothetical protein K2M34_03880 [Alphaproteobacteria bacterium]|nr:hypothetical protein [Alphaproteobacteria bacterium]
MKRILFILPFLLTGCIGYDNTSRQHSHVKSAPFSTGVAPYIDMNKYTIADIKETNKGQVLVSEYSDGDMHYLEYSAPRAARLKWLGFGVIIPVYIPKFSPRNDTIRYAFTDGLLTDIDFDYYRHRNKIFPLVPLDCWGNMRPSSPVMLYRGMGYEYDVCFNKTEYINNFFDNNIGCEFPVIKNENHWNIAGLNFVAPFAATKYYEHVPVRYTNPEPRNGSRKEYYDYECTGDKCIKMSCIGDKCEPAETKTNDIEPTTVEIERWHNLSCSHVPALGIKGVIYHNNGYVIQVIDAPHINRERAIEYIIGNAQSYKTENINGIEMTLIQQTYESGQANIAIFFDNNKIYMIYHHTTQNNDGTEFNQLLHTVGLDSINVPQN